MIAQSKRTCSRLTTFIVLCSTLACGLPATALAVRPLEPAPDFALTDLTGRTVSLQTLRGQNVLLFFGTTRCPHCDTALPILESLSQFLDDNELKVAFIALNEDAESLAGFVSRASPPYSVLPDESATVGRKYDIRRVPTCVFIDKDGLIQYVGRPNEDIVWRLLSGERPVYPEVFDRGVHASERLTGRGRPRERESRRFIVELDEEPWLAKRLSKAARRVRRAQFHEAARQMDARVVHNYGRLKNKIVVEIPPDKVARLRELPRFKNFREDRPVRALLEDSAYQIKADYAWDNAVTGQGVKVCVVDTGIDYTHPDLQNKVIAQHDFLTDTGDAMDDHGHGTHCAGIIASEGLKFRGVSYDVTLLAAKVLDASGNGFESDVVLGINWCVEQGADVISLSLGEGLYSGTCDDTEMAEAVNEAVDAGAVVVCAAGNDGTANSMVSPACASKAIAVGAVDKFDNIASYSDGGTELDLVAPGGGDFGGADFPEIVSTYSTEVANNPLYCMYLIADECYDYYFVVDGTRYIRAIGTSMAAPHVAAAAALLLEENQHLSPSEIKTALEQNADDMGPPGWDNVYGWGRVNIEKALDNIPPEPAELTVKITGPNVVHALIVNEGFALSTEVECYGGDGCGEVLAHAQFCKGRDCDDFVDINTLTTISTTDENPNDLGVMSGYTLETDVPMIFDAQTVLDISEATYTKSIDPNICLVGSELPAQYNTGDLEPQDGVGAIGQDAQELYEFQIPPGVVKSLKVRMENYLVLHFNYPPFAGWRVYTAQPDGEVLHLVGDCTPAEGGGGEVPSPDCWFTSDDPAVLAHLNPGGTSYIKLVSHDVGEDDWLTFNDIEVIVEYEIDPNNDEVYQYYVKFDLRDIDPSQELTAARLKVNIAENTADCVAEAYLVDHALSPTDAARAIHEANAPSYSGVINPIKSFSCENKGTISLNVKAGVDDALATNQDAIAFQIRQRNNERLFGLAGSSSERGPTLTISQKVPQGLGTPGSGGQPTENPDNGPRTLTYDSMVVKDVSALRTALAPLARTPSSFMNSRSRRASSRP